MDKYHKSHVCTSQMYCITVIVFVPASRRGSSILPHAIMQTSQELRVTDIYLVDDSLFPKFSAANVFHCLGCCSAWKASNVDGGGVNCGGNGGVYVVLPR